MLPNRIFFTGVPGSRWSSIAQTLEQLEGVNTSDHKSNREYAHGKFSGHKGAYFGTGMEFETYLDPKHIDSAWTEPGSCQIVKSHEWSLKLQTITEVYPDDWVMLIYRPDASSYAWWHEAGGFNINYPDYSAYKNHAGMLGEITKQNDAILKFAHKHNLTWNYFTSKWVEDNFGQQIEVVRNDYDILVTILKGPRWQTKNI
jgi:hypothetical protein